MHSILRDIYIAIVQTCIFFTHIHENSDILDNFIISF